MTTWMIWATAVTSLLAAAGLALERALRTLGRPARFGWLAAGLASAGLMAWSRLAPTPAAPADGSSGAMETLTADLLRQISGTVQAAPAAVDRADALLGWGWAISAALLLTGLIGGLWRISRRAGRWPSARVPGGEVLVSDAFGPALVGLRSPRIVVPRWLLCLGAEPTRMAYLHEAEHRRSGDGLLLFSSALLAAAAPWNVALWWIHARLRAAVEMDCDQRVLDAGVHPVSYGALLLEIGTRAAHMPGTVAAFARPRTTLERRMTMIVRDRDDGMGPGRVGRATIGLAAVALLVAVACETPAPTQPGQDGETAAASGAEVANEVTNGVTPRELDGDAGEPAGTLARPSTDGQDETVFGLERTDRQEGPVGEARGRLGPFPTIAAREDGSRPLIFVDGVRLADPAAGLEELRPDRIERIEVIKGGAARALFGEEAADGVIQIFLKESAR